MSAEEGRDIYIKKKNLVPLYFILQTKVRGLWQEKFFFRTSEKYIRKESQDFPVSLCVMC